MADTDAQRLEACLRQEVVSYLRERSPWRPPLAAALGRLSGPPRPIYLFGGLLRDLLLFGPDASPRDVDLVIGGGTTGEELADALTAYIDRRTRFGGLQLVVEGVPVDKGRPALAEALFYLTCRSEQIVSLAAEKLVHPALATGGVSRTRLMKTTNPTDSDHSLGRYSSSAQPASSGRPNRSWQIPSQFRMACGTGGSRKPIWYSMSP